MHAPLHVLCAGAVALALASTGCSERDPARQPPVQGPAASARFEPSFDVRALQKVSSKVAASGVATQYDAYFDQQQLKAIVEERQDTTTIRHGEYLYTGARLMQYTGSALSGTPGDAAGTIELKFDLQGRLLSARSLQDAGRSVEQAQIDALRVRAELLRSHALTQRSINAHQQTGEARG